MEIVEYGLSRAIRFGDLVSAPSPPLLGSNLIRAVTERYGFVEAPRTVADYNLQNGMLFLHGYHGANVIERLHVYNNGVLAEMKSDTSDCDAFLDDLTLWAAENAGIAFSKSSLADVYLSQLFVRSESIAMDKALAPLAVIREKISARVEAAAPMRVLPSQVMSFQIATDPGLNGGWNYRFERRVGSAFADNAYFSSAPLTTVQHLEMLNEIEVALG